MISRALRLILKLGIVTGLGAAVFKIVRGRRPATVGTMPSGEPPIPTGPPKSTQPLVEPAMLKGLDLRRGGPDEDATAENGRVAHAPVAAAASAVTVEIGAEATGGAVPPRAPAAGEDRLWVEPEGGICPTSHPVKAKLSSQIFHLPGMTAYDRTTPDRCYRDAAAAESDGLRQAKR